MSRNNNENLHNRTRRRVGRRDGKMFRYGEEYKTLWQDGIVKYVTPRDGKQSIRIPEETRVSDRIYATIDKNNQVKYITYYGSDGEKSVQIDLKHPHNGLQPHAHDGKDHGEGRKLTSKEIHDMERILKRWEEYHGK